jgi:hypothetical protein
MPLLYLAQREKATSPSRPWKKLRDAGHHPTDVASIVGFYTLYHDEKARRQIPHAGLHRPALRPARRGQVPGNLCENLGIKVGETTPTAW